MRVHATNAGEEKMVKRANKEKVNMVAGPHVINVWSLVHYIQLENCVYKVGSNSEEHAKSLYYQRIKVLKRPIKRLISIDQQEYDRR